MVYGGVRCLLVYLETESGAAAPVTTLCITTEEPSSCIVARPAPATKRRLVSAHSNGWTTRLAQRTVAEADDGDSNGHAFVGTARSKHVAPRACRARWREASEPPRLAPDEQGLWPLESITRAFDRATLRNS